MINRSLRGQRLTRTSRSHIDPKVLVQVLEEPLLALATAVVLQALDDRSASPDAHGLFFGSWFSLFAEALDSEPQRLRARLGVSDLSAETT